jgi:hypothetical protein
MSKAGVRGRPIAPLALSAQERAYLERQVRRHRIARSLSERCRVILRCADGKASKDVAAELGLHEHTVAGLTNPKHSRRGNDPGFSVSRWRSTPLVRRNALTSVDDVVCANHDCRWDDEVQAFSRLKIDDQLELGRLLDRDIRRFCALEGSSRQSGATVSRSCSGSLPIQGINGCIALSSFLRTGSEIKETEHFQKFFASSKNFLEPCQLA